MCELLAAGKDIKVAFDIMVQTAHRLFDGRLLGSYLIYDRAIEESFHMIFNGEDVPSLINGKILQSCTIAISVNGNPLVVRSLVHHYHSFILVWPRIVQTRGKQGVIDVQLSDITLPIIQDY